ncbi:DUF2625 domain-containing protein [Mucilaginibacter flavus]|uniref:DUF2625 domain-containing protein n=1 Tax=Mucilaginibacter flavus TaxID=931504 RepID=UPI0025B61770|nr:DUF2625 domain-containing protein [Mucilaginibacter flavus]MDN3580679.1 DUF2625 domain-containing protein [Mucilaginibacter flavus]
MKKQTLSLLLLAFTLSVNAQMKLRPIAELTADTSAWPLLLQDIKSAKNKVEILPASNGKEALYQTQVSTHSYMGAVIYFTGGILVDNGWIRILGSGSKKLQRSLPDWNKGKSFNQLGEQPSFLLIADDADGGFFAINGGKFGDDMGKVYYLAPERLKWEALHISYSEFLNFCWYGDMKQFYDGLRWTHWQDDLSKLKADEVFTFYPYLWTAEGKDINKVTRNVTPIQEAYIFSTENMKTIKP